MPAPPAVLAPDQPATATDQPTATLPAGGDRQNPPEIVVWAGYGKSDNIARTELAQIDGSYDGVGALLSLAHKSTRLDAKINGDVEYRVYSDDSLDNETVGTMDASAKIGIVPNRFAWLFEENFGQGLRDVFAPLGPENRESINVASTGPTVDLPLGARTDLEMRGLYSSRRYEQSSDIDTSSIVYELAALRDISSTAKLGLVANTNDIEYTEIESPSYRIDGYNLRYEKTLATGHVRAEAGGNEISSGGRSDREPLFRFEWVRSVTARSDLNVAANREFTDSTSLIGTAPPSSGSGAPAVLVTPNPLEHKQLNVSYTVRMRRSNLSAGIGAFDERYVGNTALDNDGTTLRFGLSHDVSPHFDIGVNYDLTKRDFSDPAAFGPTDRDATASAWISTAIGRRFSLALALSHYDRRGAQNFDENRCEIRFGYSPTESAAAALRSVGR